MKLFAFLLLALVCPHAEELSELASASVALPPEFASDALLRIASSDRLDDPQKIALIEQAFQRAALAQAPYKRRSAWRSGDGMTGYWNRVNGQELDALSLRVRAVRAMLPLDALKARALFERIPDIKPPKLTCDGFLVDDLDSFYEALGAVFHTASDPSALLKKYTASLTSAVEVAPMARVLAASGVKDADFEALLAAFSASLAAIPEDDRAFTASDPGKEILALADEARRRHISPLQLIESYRVYLIVHLSGTRCADDDLMQSGPASFGLAAGTASGPALDVKSFFNRKLRVDPLLPIPELESTPSRVEGVATGLRSCEEAPCVAIATSLRRLILSENGTPYTPDQRDRQEWQTLLQSTLALLAEWKPEEAASPAEYFRVRSRAYFDLLSLAQGSSRERVLLAMLGFVSNHAFREDSRAEWFLPVNALIARMAVEPAGLRLYSGDLARSNDKIISLYTRLELAVPRPLDQVMRLLQ